MSTILFVDDEPGTRFGVSEFLRAHGFQVVEAATAADAESRFRSVQPSLTILDYRLPDDDGIGTLARLRRIDSATPVVMLTGHGTIDLAVTAVKAGAEHLLTKPVNLGALLEVIRRVLAPRAQPAARERGALDPFVGESGAIRQLRAQARLIAAADQPTLILGETGAGKGVLAKWLHAHSRRATAPFVDLNCAGLSRELLESELFGHERGAFTGAVGRKAGLFEAADGGTLFLDEFGDLEPALQPKLLKVVEEKRFRRVGDVRAIEVNVRLVAATNVDLPARVRDGGFRADLYFRMSTVVLAIPPLRQRREDIAPLARALLTRAGADPALLGAEALARLEGHHWPGNVRELANVLERARLFADGGPIDAAHIVCGPGEGGAAVAAEATWPLDEVERRHIERAIAAADGRVEEAAALLKIPRSTLYHKLRRYRLRSKNENP